MPVNYRTIVERFRKSSQQWIMPIPILENGELKIMCLMKHDKKTRITDDKPIYFDAYYTYKVSLLVLHNFLLEKSCGKAYWKYVRCKEPRTDFLGLDDSKKDIYINEQAIKEIMLKGRTEYIFELINKKFDDIDHDFTTDKEDDDIIDDIKDMGYNY